MVISNLVLGSIIFISPLIFPTGTLATWNAYLVGLAVIFLALFKGNWARWSNMLTGAWFLVASFVFQSSRGFNYFGIIFGAAVIAMAYLAMTPTRATD